MNRGLLLSAVLVLAVGGWAWGQCGCPPVDVDAPECYVSFQQCQKIEVGLRTHTPFSFLFICSPCCRPAGPQVHSWRVENLDGQLIYGETLRDSVRADSFSAVWDQRDGDGKYVSPGYYAVIVDTDEGEFVKHLRIVDRCQSFFSLFGFGSRCCSSRCEPEVTLEQYTEPCMPRPCTVSPCCP